MGRELRYAEPAACWLEALPIGNGSFGGMVHGGIDEDVITLNEESFWAGYRQDWNRKTAFHYLDQVRDSVSAGRYKEAQETIEREMLSAFNQPYQPLGILKIRSSHQKKAGAYERKLQLGCGLAETRYEADDTEYRREYFSSYPDQVMAVRLTARGNSRISCSVSMDSLCMHSCRAEGRELVLDVTAPAEVKVKDVYLFPEDSEVIYDESKPVIKGQIILKAYVKGGQMKTEDQSLVITEAEECVFLLAASTTFKTGEVENENRRCLQKAEMIGYEELKTRHTADVESIMERVRLELNPDTGRQTEDLTGDIDRKSEQMTELLFDFGRYLLVSSSRRGTLPANLQGIWNAKNVPPWWSNWTMNINLEMNYWMACRANMTECMEPLLAFVEELSQKGTETAKQHYGCRGWTAHHMTDIWMDTSPIGYAGEPMEGSAAWAMWPMSGVWLCLHLWEYYEYTGDLKYLRERAYPVILGCLDFLMDWLVCRDGVYHTLPSTSPENMYLSEDGPCPVCDSSAMDMELIREFMETAQQAMEAAGETEAKREELKKYLGALSPVRTGKDGEILEWSMQVPETEPGHRHFSHLFSLYPGHQFLRPENRSLKDAAEISLKRRMENGGGATGWSRVWAICLWARLGYGEQALDSVEKFQEEDVFTNLFGYCPPEYFQIDCNLGFPAAVMEMLLQEENGIIRPLPALPEKWKDGQISGLLCRGGHRLDLEWENSRISRISLSAKHDGAVRIQIPPELGITQLMGCQASVKDGVLELKLDTEKTYEIQFTENIAVTAG